jgi:hypothetical protein
MEKIFKTDNGEIKLECENNAVKISQGENFLKFTGAKAPFNAFEDDIETFMKQERKDLGECRAESLFDTLLNFYSALAKNLGKAEIFCDHFVITDYAEWIAAKELKLTTEVRTVKKTEGTVTYELGDKFKMIFDSKGNTINIDAYENISEEEIETGKSLIKEMLFGK